MTYKPDAARTCPSCASPDIDRQRQECRACGIGLPAGSLDVEYRRVAHQRQSKKAGAAAVARRTPRL